MGGLRAGSGGQPPGPARPGSQRALPGAAVSAGVHPEGGRRLRPLGIAALEDKILQRAVVEVLNAVYETDFLGFSYGFRPRRSPHDALDALAAGIYKKKVNWVLDADIRDFFTSLDQGWLRSSSGAGTRTSGACAWSASGWARGSSRTGHGESTGGVAARGIGVPAGDVYLPYVLDLWAGWWRKRHARGDMMIVRFS